MYATIRYYHNSDGARGARVNSYTTKLNLETLLKYIVYAIICYHHNSDGARGAPTLSPTRPRLVHTGTPLPFCRGHCSSSMSLFLAEGRFYR